MYLTLCTRRPIGRTEMLTRTDLLGIWHGACVALLDEGRRTYSARRLEGGDRDAADDDGRSCRMWRRCGQLGVYLGRDGMGWEGRDVSDGDPTVFSNFSLQAHEAGPHTLRVCT